MLKNVLNVMLGWLNEEHGTYTLTDEELCALPGVSSLQGVLWAVLVDEHGVPQDQPAYDPWGKLWLNR